MGLQQYCMTHFTSNSGQMIGSYDTRAYLAIGSPTPLRRQNHRGKERQVRTGICNQILLCASVPHAEEI